MSLNWCWHTNGACDRFSKRIRMKIIHYASHRTLACANKHLRMNNILANQLFEARLVLCVWLHLSVIKFDQTKSSIIRNANFQLEQMTLSSRWIFDVLEIIVEIKVLWFSLDKVPLDFIQQYYFYRQFSQKIIHCKWCRLTALWKKKT